MSKPKYLYENFPYCKDCPNKEENKTVCAEYWRPGTGTKEGFPIKQADGTLWNCPKDTVLKYKDTLIVDEFKEIGKPLEELLSKGKQNNRTDKREYKEYHGSLGTFNVNDKEVV